MSWCFREGGSTVQQTGNNYHPYRPAPHLKRPAVADLGPALVRDPSIDWADEFVLPGGNYCRLERTSRKI